MPNQGDIFTNEFKDRGPKFRDAQDRLMLVWKDASGKPYDESLRALQQRIAGIGASAPKEFWRAYDAAKEYNFVK